MYHSRKLHLDIVVDGVDIGPRLFPLNLRRPTRQRVPFSQNRETKLYMFVNGGCEEEEDVDVE